MCSASPKRVQSTAQWHDQQESPRSLQQHMADAVSRSFQCDIGVVLPSAFKNEPRTPFTKTHIRRCFEARVVFLTEFAYPQDMYRCTCRSELPYTSLPAPALALTCFMQANPRLGKLSTKTCRNKAIRRGRSPPNRWLSPPVDDKLAYALVWCQIRACKVLHCTL